MLKKNLLTIIIILLTILLIVMVVRTYNKKIIGIEDEMQKPVVLVVEMNFKKIKYFT